MPVTKQGLNVNEIKLIIENKRIQLHIIFFKQKVLLFITTLDHSVAKKYCTRRVCTEHYVGQGERWWLKRRDSGKRRGL